jgi:hypothetical protein
MAPGIEVEFEEAWAVTVTIPVCMHCAMPFWLMVAMSMFDTDQPPENGATNVTGAGDGGRLKVPVAVNCTCPFMEFPPLAIAGATVMDMSMRLEFIMFGFIALQPMIVNRTANRPILKR